MSHSMNDNHYRTYAVCITGCQMELLGFMTPDWFK